MRISTSSSTIRTGSLTIIESFQLVTILELTLVSSLLDYLNIAGARLWWLLFNLLNSHDVNISGLSMHDSCEIYIFIITLWHLLNKRCFLALDNIFKSVHLMLLKKYSIKKDFEKKFKKIIEQDSNQDHLIQNLKQNINILSDHLGFW